MLSVRQTPWHREGTLLRDAPSLDEALRLGGLDFEVEVRRLYTRVRQAARVQLVDAEYGGPWELPAIGAVTAPTAVLVRPDGYVAWVGDRTRVGLADALTTWFGPPTAA